MKPLLMSLLLGATTLAMPVYPAASFPDDLADQVTEITEDYNTSYQDWLADYRAASTEERKELAEMRPDPVATGDEVLGLVQGSPASAAAFIAGRWVVERVYDTDMKGRALDLLREHHLTNPELGAVAQRVRGGDAAANKFLEAAMDVVESPELKGKICYSLATGLASSLNAPSMKESKGKKIMQTAEKHFARCAGEFADVVLYPARGDRPSITIGDRVGHDLFELRNLTRGRNAPDIVAEDIDGVSFKLSDYKGKVVMLDFWGDW